MKTIWKYEMPVGSTTFMMPEGAEVLSFHTQRGAPCFWAKVDTDGEPEERHFMIVGTGHEFNDNGAKFIGTVLVAEDRLVWHLFEIVPVAAWSK